ncbi:hypothetical protein [Chryseobacterium soli]|uniref:hypothetical protein n=1 Tax=Chryseobacterium soli TaxID=445961 RepID=UPI0006911560|nr:hypothetical protein [Chryseobacterium soli]
MTTEPTPNSENNDLPAAPNTMLTPFIQGLIDNYRIRQLNVINGAMNIDDAHSIWFDLPTLKKFIADIEAETQKVDTAITESSLGVRFHYAAYPRIEDWDQMADQPIVQEYAGKHTLVMIPTLKIADENGEMLNYDFNPMDSSTYSITQETGIENEQVMAMGAKSPKSILCQNHGALIPPDLSVVEQF